MNELFEKIASKIKTRGVISFAEFMGFALYCPVYGYYEREKDTIGRRGDFYTNVSVGSLFGELLAVQFAEWGDSAESEAGGGKWQIVEAGAHDGSLAADILGWFQKHRAGLFEMLEYLIIEPSAIRREWQQEKLIQFGGKIAWAQGLNSFVESSRSQPATTQSAHIRGVIFCNELLDAMPVHRLAWDAGRHVWLEWGVALNGGRLVWQRFERDPKEPESALTERSLKHAIGGLPEELLDQLPNGFVIEVSPAAEEWWRTAATALMRGKLVAIDYGLTLEEIFTPERKDGTLRAYHQHRLSGDVLANPGEQDITAHVGFSTLQAAGELAGLRTEAFSRQEQFLTQIATRLWKDPGSCEQWTQARARQFQTLTHPEHFGTRFRVLIQSRA